MSSRAFKFNFSEGEKVLCYEPDPNKAKVLYDSKILECCVKKDSKSRKTAEYLVHFYGWNSSWDRHVAECNILKDNPENRTLQRQLAEIAAEPLKGKKLKLNKIPAIIREVVVSLPRENNNDNEKKDSQGDGKMVKSGGDVDGLNSYSDESNGKSDVNSENNNSESSQHDDGPLLQPTFMQLPDDLKKILEDDAEKVDGKGKCHNLPVKVTVKMILDKYLSEHFDFGDGINNCSITTRTRTSIAKKESQYIFKEFVYSMEKYFNSLLSDHLLYSCEKTQLLTLKKHKNLEMTSIYGFIHLLRLLVVLPEFFIVTPGITKKQSNALHKLFQDFISFLNKNKSNFMKND
ncbi:male-specific lethal 3 homolog [Panonychus citri]|uniref:male-specific lethal 3 homolog n=1 Tax=Panonychus citri TaxID=50023 RepID=UPI002306FD86|nr:male-specific lethal 3 homolog [Panonychus citri]